MLARFVFEACGAVDAPALVGESLDLEAGDGEALRDPLEALSDQLGAKDRPHAYPVHEPSGKKAGFGARFDAVWGKIVDRCRSGSSYDAEALGAVSQTLGACARHDVVHCRHAGAAGAMEVGLAVAAAAASLEAQVASCAAQLEALGGGAKPKRGSKAEAVRKRKDDLEASLERLDELGEAIFDDVFCKRYRDVHGRVRVAVVERLGKWIAARPAKYLDTRYLKYVAWVLDFPEGSERAAAAGALARAFGAVDENTREALGDFAARFVPRLAEMAHDADEAAQAAAVGALDACMDCGLLADLDLGEDDVADVTDKVYSKIVDEAAAPELRAACLGLALKYEDFDVARAGGDGAKTLHDLGRFVEASILGDDGPLALAPLAADAFLDLGEDSRALLQDWRAWVDVLGRDDVGTQSPQAARLVDVLLRLFLAAANRTEAAGAEALGAALLDALPGLLRKYGADDGLLPHLLGLAAYAARAPTKDARYVAVLAAALGAVERGAGDAPRLAAEAARAFVGHAKAAQKQVDAALGACCGRLARALRDAADREDDRFERDAAVADGRAASRRLAALAAQADVAACLKKSDAARLLEDLKHRVAEDAAAADGAAVDALDALASLHTWVAARAVARADGAKDDGDAPADPAVVAAAAAAKTALVAHLDEFAVAPQRSLAEAQDGVNGAKSLRSDLDRDAWAALHAAQLRALAVAGAAGGGLAHPGLRHKRGFAALALPVDDDRDLAALAADVVWRHGAAALGATPARPTPKHYASSWKAATKDASPARLVLEPALQFVAGGRPDTPQREDLFAAVLAVAAAAKESEILAAAAEALAAHPDDAATVHLRALDRVAALLGADDGDEDEHEAARDAVADLGAALAKALRASFGDDAAAATDALHGVLHGGLDAAFANPPASLAGLAGLLPYVADGRKNAKSSRARRDAGLRASVLEALDARSRALRRPDGADDDDDDDAWARLDAFEAALRGGKPRPKPRAPPPPEPEEPAPRSGDKRRRASSRPSSARSTPLGKIDESADEDDDAAPAPPRAESDSDDDPLPGGRRTYDAPPLLEPLAEDGADSDSDDEPIMPAARRAYSGDAGHITTDDDDDDADAADRKRRRSWMPAAPLEEEEEDDDDEDESPPPKKKPASRRGRK